MALALRGRTLMVLSLTAMALACVDAPSEPLAASANNPLATSFEMLADEQMGVNDVERSEEFRWAALALRAGVTPSVIEVVNEGKVEVFDGFVHAVTWATVTQSLRLPQHRTLVAWRRSGDLLQVILIGLAADSAPVVHPLSLRPPSPGTELTSPVAGATAAYFERGTVHRTSIGIGGAVKVAEHPRPTACPTTQESTRPSGVTCSLTRYGIAVNVLFAPTRDSGSRDLDLQAATRRVIAAPQTMAGVKLVFNCGQPLGTGC